MSRIGPIRPAREVLDGADDAARTPAAVIDEIASELNLLSQSHRNPEAFLERRDMLVKRLRRLAKVLVAEPSMRRVAVAAAPAATPRPPRVLPIMANARSTARGTLRLKGLS